MDILSSESIKNHLLAALPDGESRRWLPLLESVDLPLGEVLYESGAALSHVYFPTTAIISLLYVMENGASAEIAVVGNEGIVGISLFMGGESTFILIGRQRAVHPRPRVVFSAHYRPRANAL